MASTAEEDVVRKAVAALLRIWLNDTASRFQKAVASTGLPSPQDQGAITADPREVLLFADGLRYDVARQLQKGLEVMGITGTLSTRWAGLPTVTATAKPAITPLIGEIQGQAAGRLRTSLQLRQTHQCRRVAQGPSRPGLHGVERRRAEHPFWPRGSRLAGDR
jgi:hypothetical protein